MTIPICGPLASAFIHYPVMHIDQFTKPVSHERAFIVKVDVLFVVVGCGICCAVGSSVVGSYQSFAYAKEKEVVVFSSC